MNSQELIHDCTASIICVAWVRQGRRTLVELKHSARTDQVPEVLNS